MRVMGRQLHEGQLPTGVRSQLVAAAELTSHLDLRDRSLSTMVIVAQLRSILVDLIQLTGVSAADARDLIPEMD